MPISNKVNANQLFDLLKLMLDGLIEKNLNVISYAADGSGVERSVQNLLDLSCRSRTTLSIKHPRAGKSNILINIPLYGPQEQAIAILQDSQHGLKTFRNNAFGGARMLVLGNFVVLYHHFRRISTEGGPLFERDVVKIDRQDDSAAIRLFSADALAWLTDNYPELLGPIVYLFVFGELIDAYQNRHIPHIERVQMVFRTLFFMEIWEEFLDKAGYRKGTYFLSKEACDIVKYLINGFIKLIIVYRDHLPGTYPLLPWLLSTEPCEHIFGLCRQILQDFTMHDFLHMIPKLFIRLREAALFGPRHLSDGKERASGYTHNYCDARDIDLNALSTFPSDNEIQEAAVMAYQQAENLWFLLGFVPSDEERSATQLPSIKAWFTPEENTFEPPHDVHSDYESDVGDDSDSVPTEAMQLQAAIDRAEKLKLSFSEEDVVNNLTFAAVALSVNDSMEMYNVLLYYYISSRLTNCSSLLDLTFQNPVNKRRMPAFTKTEEHFNLHWISAYLRLLVQKNCELFTIHQRMISLISRH